MTHSTAAIIVAAGSSHRMGFDKLLAQLNGKPVLLHSIAACLALDDIVEVIVVCPPDRWSQLGDIPTNKPITRVNGGTERQQSVSHGLAAISGHITHVAVHDGARPLVAPIDIRRCIHAAITDGAASLAHRVTETLKRSDAQQRCIESICRNDLWAMETPQVFQRDLLQQAYLHLSQQGIQVTDEVSALQSIGAPVSFIESQHPNPKITTPADLRLAEALLKIDS